jgi:hypothetical protein
MDDLVQSYQAVTCRSVAFLVEHLQNSSAILLGPG